MSLYSLSLPYGLPAGLANLPSVLSLQHHQQQQQQHHQQQQQMGALLSAQQAQQLYEASSALSAASGSSLSASSTLSALASVSNGAQLSGGQHLSYNPLQLQAAAASGMWPQLGSFLPMSLSLAQHLQPYGSAQPLAHQHQQQQQQQQQQQAQQAQQTLQSQQQSQLQSAMSTSALSNGVAPAVFPLPPAPMLPVAHPAVSAAAPAHTQSQPLPGESEKRRRSEDEDSKMSKKRNKASRRLSSAPSSSSSTSSPAVSPSALPTSLTPPTSIHSIFSSPHHASAPLLQPMATSLTTQPTNGVPSLPASAPIAPGLPMSNNALLQLSNLTLTGSLAPSLASLANGASAMQPASLIPGALSPSGRYALPPSGSSHSSSAFSSTPSRPSTSRIDHDSISRTSSNDSGSDSDDGESSSKRKTRKKHIVTDRQRRAKIKEGMTHLRGLLLEHGSFTTDQVSIMMASVQLIHKLKDERAAVEREKDLLAAQLEQMKQYTALFIAQHAAAVDPNLAVNAAAVNAAAISGNDTSAAAASVAPTLLALQPVAPTQSVPVMASTPTSAPLSVTPSSPAKSDTTTPSPIAALKAELAAATLPQAMLVAPVGTA